jgi:hypothetical protein
MESEVNDAHDRGRLAGDCEVKGVYVLYWNSNLSG